MKIDINKKYRTASAKWPVTIVSTSGPYPGFPVVGYAHSPATNVPLLCHWSEVGGYPANTNLDLIEVRKPVTVFINQYPSGEFSTWKDRETADLNATVERIACHEVALPPLT